MMGSAFRTWMFALTSSWIWDKEKEQMEEMAEVEGGGQEVQKCYCSHLFGVVHEASSHLHCDWWWQPWPTEHFVQPE